MAGWKTESLRVFVYIFFPIAMFSIYNEPKIYEATLMPFRKLQVDTDKLEREERDAIIKTLNRRALDEALKKRED